MKIVVVGAGSTYTPELADGFARRDDRLAVHELVLDDIDEERLGIVGGLARRIMATYDWPGQLTLTSDLDAALDGADIVLIQLRVGGQQARLGDETFPGMFGCIGQETTGPGGFAKALRTVPVVLDIAERTRRLAGERAWIVDFTNPVGIVTRALLDEGHRALGLCNVAIGFQRRFARYLDVDPDAILLGHVGLNHLTWIRSVTVDGRDRLPDILARHGAELADEVELPVDLMHALGAVPSYYLRYYYEREAVVAEQRTQTPRAQEVMAIERELLTMYSDPALRSKPELLKQRGGAYYSEAAAALVVSLLTDAGETHVVNCRNGSTLAGLPPEAVIEVPALIGSGGAQPLPQRPLTPEMLGLVQAVTAYEQLAVEAAVTGDPAIARRALLAHPLVGQWNLSGELFAELLRRNAELLPQFAGSR
jgi:6-phospho-beta-glucosidase